MTEIAFITGNQDKADYLAKYLGFPVKHKNQLACKEGWVTVSRFKTMKPSQA